MKSAFHARNTREAATTAARIVAPLIMGERTATDALGSIVWALRGFDREELISVSEPFLALSSVHPRKAMSDNTESELREFLNSCAEKIYEENPESLIVLEQQLLERGRQDLKGLFE